MLWGGTCAVRMDQNPIRCFQLGFFRPIVERDAHCLHARQRIRISRRRIYSPQRVQFAPECAGSDFAHWRETYMMEFAAMIFVLLMSIGLTAPATTQSSNKIAEFQGNYRFLSNFYPAEVVFEG